MKNPKPIRTLKKRPKNWPTEKEWIEIEKDLDVLVMGIGEQ